MREEKKTAADVAHMTEEEKIAWARVQAEKQKADKKDEGKVLPAEQVTALADVDVATAELDKLAEKFASSNMGGKTGRLKGVVTDVLGLRSGDAAEYNAAALRAMQMVGKIEEGGKLAAGDELKYRKMLAQPGDSPEVVKEKTEGQKRILRDVAARRIEAFAKAGYNVSGFKNFADTPGAQAPRRARNPKTGEVVEWNGSAWVKVQ